MSASTAHDQPLSSPGRADNAAKMTGFFSTLAREPLLHFCILGGLIFAIDHVLNRESQDPKTIIVSKNRQQSFIRNFSEDGDRAPTDAQLRNMIDSWVASEILYREGKALGVDKGDEMIRDRIAFKLQSLVFDQVQLPKPTEDQLRAYFEKHRDRFDKPETVSFLLTAKTTEAAARAQLEDIQAERESTEVRNQTRVFPNRPIASLALSFGENFRNDLLGLQVGEWRMLQVGDGWHVARLDARSPGVPATFESVRDEVRTLWTTDETRQRAWAAVTKLKSNYNIKIEN